MLNVVDERRITTLLIDGKYVPALRVHLDGQQWCEEPRPTPHHVMNVMCRNSTILHDGNWHVVFTNTVEWDDHNMLSFDTEHEAQAFWNAYVLVQYQEALKAPKREKIELFRIGGNLLSDPYTPYQQTWNLYDSRDDDEPYHPDCEVCGEPVGRTYYLGQMGSEVCVGDVEIKGEP